VAGTVQEWLAEYADDIVAFAGEMVRIPSPPGNEGPLSQAIMRRLQHLDVPCEIDDVGNVLAGIPSPLESGGLLLATHTDQAPAGAMSEPFAGDLRDGAPFGIDGQILWGRGSNGQKAALAAMVYALGALHATGARLSRPVSMAGLIMEEGGGHIGPRFLNDVRGFRPQWVVIGENTDLAVHTGHRGITNLRLIVQGKASHASVPGEGVNALLSFADVCRVLEERSRELPTDDQFGPLTVTPTMVSVSPDVTNVVPELCVANLDCRVIPGWSPAQVRDLVAGWLHDAGNARGATVSVEIRSQQVTTWTGHDVESDGCILPFSTDPADPLVAAAAASVEQVTGNAPEVRLWRAGTDGGYYGGELGIPTVGIAPGQAAFSHTVHEHVPAADIPRAAAIYAALAIDLCS
jgi:putative selenium metabolism hydrolase